MTNKYFAIDALGFRHTRTSKSRAYTHTVVVPRSYERDLERALSTSHDKQEAKNFDWHTENVVRKGWSDQLVGFQEEYRVMGRDDAWIIKSAAESFARATARLEGVASLEDYLAKERAARVAAVEERAAKGYYKCWSNAGWCGRRDLAVKLSAQYPGSVILEAQEVPAKAKK